MMQGLGSIVSLDPPLVSSRAIIPTTSQNGLTNQNIAESMNMLVVKS